METGDWTPPQAEAYTAPEPSIPENQPLPTQLQQGEPMSSPTTEGAVAQSIIQPETPPQVASPEPSTAESSPGGIYVHAPLPEPSLSPRPEASGSQVGQPAPEGPITSQVPGPQTEAQALSSQTASQPEANPSRPLTPQQETERRQKIDTIASIYAKKLGIPADKVDLTAIQQAAQRIGERLPLGNMTYEQVNDKIAQLFEDDEEFQQYSLELYKEQLYQRYYQEKATQMRATQTYPEDHIHEQADAYAKGKVAEYMQNLMERKMKKSGIKEFALEEMGGLLEFIIQVLVPQIINEMQGNARPH